MMEDKRITYAKVCGREYPLCLTVAAHQKIIDKFGGLQEMSNQLEGETSVAQCAWLTHTLIEGGVAREKALDWMMGTSLATNNEVPDLELLKDAMDLAEVDTLWPVLFGAIRRSRGITVEAEGEEGEEGKNGGTTQG